MSRVLTHNGPLRIIRKDSQKFQTQAWTNSLPVHSAYWLYDIPAPVLCLLTKYMSPTVYVLCTPYTSAVPNRHASPSNQNHTTSNSHQMPDKRSNDH